MNITELSSPIRLYWDIDEARGVPVADCKRVAEEVLINKFLSVQITEAAASLSTSTQAILDTLKGRSIAVSIVAPVSVLDATAIDVFRRSGVKVFFAQISATIDLGGAAEDLRATGGNHAPGIAFSVNRENYQQLPEVLQFCIDHGITHLLLPMQRLTAKERCFSFSKKERKELTDRLSRIERPSWLKITIHDPFLWRAFFPTVEFPNGGCQAANTMLYISPEADVYPCPTLPIKLGNLMTSSLKDVIHSAAKKDLRKNILEKPSACFSCGDWSQCKGGCRGRAFSVNQTLGYPDLACR